MAVLAASLFSPTIGVVVALVLGAVGISSMPWRAWKEERDAAKVKADRLESENKDLHRENAVLLARTDLTQLREMLDQHIATVAERHALMISALTKITGRLEHLEENGHSK